MDLFEFDVTTLAISLIGYGIMMVVIWKYWTSFMSMGLRIMLSVLGIPIAYIWTGFLLSRGE